MEFQAVVLAGGRGSRFTDLTNSKGKCLLPVGNVPLLWYSLRNLVKMGFKEAIVLVDESWKSEVSAIPEKYGLPISLDVTCSHTEGSHETESETTGDAIRLIQSKITAPRILLISSDLIATESPIRRLCDLHRLHRSSFTALFFKEKPFDAKKVPGPKSKHKRERDILGLDKDNYNQVCFLSSEADLEDSLSLKRSLLREHSRINLRTDLNDAHLYVMDKWVVDYLVANPRMSTVKGELFPHLVKKQFSHKTILTPAKDEMSIAKKEEDKNLLDISNFLPRDDMILQAQSLSNWNDNSNDLYNAYYDRGLRCYVHVTNDTVYRVNNLPYYCAVTRNIKEVAELFGLPSDRRKEKSSLRSQIGENCFIGEGAQISDKTTITNTSVGSNCIIQEKVKLVDCVLMDGVTVKEGTNIQGSIICDNVVIESKCEILDCIVGRGHVIQSGKRKNEVIQDIENMMEI